MKLIHGNIICTFWDNWWSYLGGRKSRTYSARDAAFETYVKGVFDFSLSDAGEVFSRKYYIYYTQAQLNRYSYAPNKPITRTSSNEEEIFTYVDNSGGLIIQYAKMIHEYMEQNNYTYCVYDNNEYEECGQYGKKRMV